MLIYLDANIVQYCADNQEFVCGGSDACKAVEPKLRNELEALRRLVELEQLGDWTFAAPVHLLVELRAGKPTKDQLGAYKLLEEGWSDTVWSEDARPTEDVIRKTECCLTGLNLRHARDQRHLGEAIALKASWFLTNDKEVLKKVLKKAGGAVQGVRVCRPSECLQDISTGLFLR